MRFRITTIAYVFALLGAGMAVFGTWGVIPAFVAFAFWCLAFEESGKGVSLVVFLIFVAVVQLFGLGLMMVINGAGETAKRPQCAKHAAELAVGLLNYESANGAFPPAATYDANGKPMHSWRVMILPFLRSGSVRGTSGGHLGLQLDEPWDSPTNRKAAVRMPKFFACPASLSSNGAAIPRTDYFAVVGPGTIWDNKAGTKLSDVSDGLSNTLLLIEARDLNIAWTEPKDLSVEQAVELLTNHSSPAHKLVQDELFTRTILDSFYRHVIFADGRCAFEGQLSDEAVARALLTMAGGESSPIVWGGGGVVTFPNVKTEIRWARVYALTLFVALSLAPGWKWWKRRWEKLASTPAEAGSPAGNVSRLSES